MLCPRVIAGFVLDKLIVDNANAVTREDGHDLAVGLALRNQILSVRRFRVAKASASVNLDSSLPSNMFRILSRLV